MFILQALSFVVLASLYIHAGLELIYRNFGWAKCRHAWEKMATTYTTHAAVAHCIGSEADQLQYDTIMIIYE